MAGDLPSSHTMSLNIPTYILSLDLGTTGNRAMLFDAAGKLVSSAYKELTQYYPQPGWLEHNPTEIWQDTCWVIQTALEKGGVGAKDVAAMGISVQRETCLLWDKTTGKPFYNAIVWQDRRTASLCQQLTTQGKAAEIYNRTGLVIDAYFSATKLVWLLDYAKQQHPRINFNHILAGTIDTWILWNLTGGKVHATDTSNASRTMLMDLGTGEWSVPLLKLFGIPAQILPKIQPSIGLFGETQPELLGAAIPIAAMLGDQHAALFAHGCDRPGLSKCTYGTGSFLMAHTGARVARSRHQLLSTIAWTQSVAGAPPKVGYALEGSIFTSGACIQWLRDGLKMISTATDTEMMARQVVDNGGVYFVPALSGLGAPHWDMQARGAFLGMTGGVKREHLVRAVLEAIAYQVKEVVQAVNLDSGTDIIQLKVDGGACQNDFLMQFQADVLGIPVERPAILDASAQGAAFAAGLGIEFWDSYEELIAQRQIDQVFRPSTGAEQAQEQFHKWLKAVERAKNWIE